MQLGMLGTRRAVCVDADQTVEAASFAMRRQKIDRVVVMQRSGAARAPLGILSASDIVTRVVALGLDSSVVTVGDLLWSAPARARVSDTVAEALERLSAAGADALPVLDSDGRLIGVVSLEDLLVALAGAAVPRTYRIRR
jgi:CBS domain-containing protein